MDTDLIGIVFAIVLAAIIAYVERVSKKSAPAKPKQAPRRTYVPPVTVPPMQQKLPEAPKHIVELPEPVKPEKKPEPQQQQISLRQAIIWGEILRRKF